MVFEIPIKLILMVEYDMMLKLQLHYVNGIVLITIIIRTEHYYYHY
jgi:hypothetical protein